MDLNQYLAKQRISKTEFAEILGISRGHLYHVIHKTHPCGKKLAEKIEKMTGGVVSFFSLRGERKMKKAPKTRPSKQLRLWGKNEDRVC